MEFSPSILNALISGLFFFFAATILFWLEQEEVGEIFLFLVSWRNGVMKNDYSNPRKMFLIASNVILYILPAENLVAFKRRSSLACFLH